VVPGTASEAGYNTEEEVVDRRDPALRLGFNMAWASSGGPSTRRLAYKENAINSGATEGRIDSAWSPDTFDGITCADEYLVV